MKHELENRTLRLIFPGDVLSTNSETLRGDFARILEVPSVKATPWDTLSLDLRQASMLDSAGLNLLVRLVRTAKERSAKVVALTGNSAVHRALLFTRMDRQIEIIGPQG